MRWMNRKAIKAAAAAIIAWAAFSVAAFGQSTPGLRQGQVPTAGQWNSYFAAKQDYLGFTPLNPSSIVGSGAVTVAPGGGVITVGCATCFLNSGGTITTTGIGPGIGITQSVTGSFAPATALNYITASDTAEITGGGYYFNVLIGMGAGMKGNRVAIAGSVGLNATTGNLATFGEYTAVYGGATAAANDNGTPGAPRGSFFGSNFVGAAFSGATHLVGVTAGEDDIAMQTGSSADYVWIRVLAHALSHGVRGSVVDTMLALTSQGTGSTQTSNFGIWVGPVSAGASQYPLGADSTLLYAAPTIAPGPTSILNGIVLDATITGNAFVSNGIAISGAGAIVASATAGGHVLAAGNTFPLTVKTSAAATPTVLVVDTTSASQSSFVGFYDAATIKWYAGKLGSNDFTIFDGHPSFNASVISITPNTGVVNVTNILNATTGYRVNGAAASGNVLRGNGTNFVSTQLSFADLASGTTAPAFTLGGTVSGGGNQINNVIIGTTTPLAGSFTTLTTSDNHTFTTAAKTIVFKQGANGAVGTFTCVSASNVTVNNTYIAANDTVIIFYESGTAGATPPAGNAKTNATSFRVACASGDTAVYNYAILKNAA